MKYSLSCICHLLMLLHAIVQVPGQISVSCGYDEIRILVQDMAMTLQRLGAKGFYIGRDLHCQADARGLMSLHFPFRRCQTEAEVFEDGVLYSNTIFVRTMNASIYEYGEFRCQYGNVQIQKSKDVLATKTRVDDKLIDDVILCKSMYYCPRQVCPSVLRFGDQAVFFAPDSLHMTIATKEKAHPSLVSAIDHLSILCSDKTTSSPLQYRSVTNGCSAKRPVWYSAHEVQTVMTQINFNLHSSVICISFDIPPADKCRSFVIKGTVVQCLKSDRKVCKDFSGSRCSESANTYKGNFTLGPFYVLAKTNKVEAFVRYPHDFVTSTTRSADYFTKVPDERTTAFDTRTLQKSTSPSITEGIQGRNINLVDTNIVKNARPTNNLLHSDHITATSQPRQLTASNTGEAFQNENTKTSQALRKEELSFSLDGRVSTTTMSNNDETSSVNRIGQEIESTIARNIVHEIAGNPTQYSQTITHVTGVSTTKSSDGGGVEASTDYDDATSNTEINRKLESSQKYHGFQTGTEGIVRKGVDDAIPPASTGVSIAVIDSSVRSNAVLPNSLLRDIRYHRTEGNVARKYKPVDAPKKGEESFKQLEFNNVSVVTQEIQRYLEKDDNRHSRSSVESFWYGPENLQTADSGLKADESGDAEKLRIQESGSPLRHFNDEDANKGFIWAGVSALGLFVVCSIALVAAWAVKRRSRRREWPEMSSRL